MFVIKKILNNIFFMLLINMNNQNLLLIDTRINDLPDIIDDIKINTLYILVDYYTDTFNDLTSKIINLGLNSIDSVGLLRHGYYTPTYKMLDLQQVPSELFDDPELVSWYEIKSFITFLINNYQIKYFDFISCRFDLYPDVFTTLESQLNINVGTTTNDIGNIQYGGTWILDSHNLLDIYFNDTILNYPYLFFIPTLTITANSFIKIYDRIVFTSNTATYNGFADPDTYLSIFGTTKLSGIINYTGTFTNAINAGIYTIIPSGLTSDSYFIYYVNGTLTIIPDPLYISINNYIKVYNGIIDMPNYVVNYSGLAPGEDFSTFIGTLTLSGINYSNVGNYTIVPSGLSSINYTIYYNNSTFTIIPEQLLIVANNVSKIYDQTYYYGGGGVIYYGLVGNDTSANLIGTLTYSGTSQGAYSIGTYPIIPSGLSSSNYTITYSPGNLIIYSDSFLVKANDYDKFYDNLYFTNNAYPTTSYTGDISNIPGPLVFSGTYQNNKDVNDYSIEVTGLGSPNYNINYYSGTLSIVQNELFVIASSYTYIYNSIPFTNMALRFEGFQGNDTSSCILGAVRNIGTSYLAVNIGTYNIVPSNIYSTNYKLLIVPGTLNITQNALYINTRSFTKIYDGTTIISGFNMIVSISGIMNNEIITVASYYVQFNNINVGYQYLTISNFTLSGFTLPNYYILTIPPVLCLILPKLVVVRFTGIPKIYDGTLGTILSYTLSGILSQDIVDISNNYYANYSDIYVGLSKTVTVSSIVLTSRDYYNYYINPNNVTYNDINVRLLTPTFFSIGKVFDRNSFAPVYYSLSGFVNTDWINVDLSRIYISNYRNVNVNSGIYIDISNIKLYGPLAYNYYTIPNITISGVISKKYLYTSKIDKIYDQTTLAYVNISGIIDNDIISYVARFDNINVGLEKLVYITLSNKIIPNSNDNYQLFNPIITGNIFQKLVVVQFTGIPKIYDGTLGTILSYTLSGIIPGDIVDISNNYYANYSDIYVGLSKTVTISNIVLTSLHYYNYYINPNNISYNDINVRLLTPTFFSIGKVFDRNSFAPVYYSLSGFVNTDWINVDLSKIYISNYRNVNVNSGIYIDISNIKLYGPLAYNYYTIPNITISGVISKKYLYTSKIDKIYDQTTLAYVNISGIIDTDIISYIARFDNINVGLEKLVYITLSNKIIPNSNDNYQLFNPIITGNVFQKLVVVRFTGIPKIYDGTLGTILSYTLSGIIPGDIVDISNNYYANYSDIYVGLSKTVTVSSIVLTDLHYYNYYINPNNITYNDIYVRLLTPTFFSIGKVFDRNSFAPVYYSLSGFVNTDWINVDLSRIYISNYRNVNVNSGIYIDISNIKLYGPLAYNYYTIPNISISGVISKKYLYTSKIDKIYDQTTLAYVNISGIIDTDIISYIARFDNINVGQAKTIYITLSNKIIPNSNDNYQLFNPIITGNVFQKLVVVQFTGIPKIYDGTTGTILSYTLSGIIPGDIVDISNNYYANYSDIYVGLSKTVTISNIVLTSLHYYNYYINPNNITYNDIYIRLLTPTFFSIGKVFDRNSFAPVYYSLSGFVNTDWIDVDLSRIYISNYRNVNVNSGIYIDISNIQLYGMLAYNYYTIPNITISGVISKRYLYTYGVDKTYDQKTVALITISNIIDTDVIYYVANFMDINVGQTKLVNITLSNYIYRYPLPYYNYTSPVDQLSVNAKNGLVGAYGLSLLLSTYTGPILNILRDSDNSITDVYSDCSGNLTTNTGLSFSNWLNGANAYVNIWYDQSGKQNNALSHINSPTFSNNQINFSNSYLKLPNGTIPYYNSSYSIVYHHQNAVGQVLGCDNNSFIIDSNYSNIQFSFGAYSDNNVISETYNSLTNIMNGYVNGILNNSIIANPNNTSPFNNTIGLNLTGGLYYLYIFNTSLNDSDRNIVENNNTIFNKVFYNTSSNNNYQLYNNTVTANVFQKQLNITFTTLDKIYNTLTDGQSNYSISGIIYGDIVDISNIYTTNFIDTYVGNTKTVFINYVNLIGSSYFNYNTSISASINGNLLQAVATPIFYLNKFYDKTNSLPIFYSLSGIFDLEAPYLTLSGCIFGLYRDYNANVGIVVDISNILLIGFNSQNYSIINYTTVSGNIIPKYLNTYGNDKIYDSYPDAIVTISGTVSGDIIIYIARFSDWNVANNKLITVSLSAFFPEYNNNNNYQLASPYTNANIYYKNLVISFTGGSKNYDSYRDAGSTIYGTISGIMANDVITISSFVSMFQDQNNGLRFIDTSNIILSGYNRDNYFILPVESISGIISIIPIYVTMTGGTKIYDTNAITGPTLLASISGMIANEIINISSYTSSFNTYLAGLRRIDVSNVVLDGFTLHNYELQPVIPIYQTISLRPATLYFTGGSKIYDSTIIPSTLSSYLVNTLDELTVNNLVPLFITKNIGYNLINIINVTIDGVENINYDFTVINTLSAFIYPRYITTEFFGGYTMYVKNSTFRFPTISGILFNTIPEDNITISNATGVFRNYTSGYQIIDISDIILDGQQYFNYIIEPVPPIMGYIYQAPLYAVFTANDKTYDGNTNVINLQYSLSGIFLEDSVYLPTYTGFYVNTNIGYQRVDISNATISGPDAFNYYLNPVGSIYTNILLTQLILNFNNGNKIYDTNTSVGTLTYTISGMTGTGINQIVSIYSYAAKFRNPNAGMGIIDVSSVVLTGSAIAVSSYIINPIVPFQAIIIQKPITIVFTNLNKTYDGTQSIIANTISAYIIGLVGTDTLQITSFTGLYKSFLASNTYLDISNVTLSGPKLANYVLLPVQAQNATILKRLITVTLSGGNKIYNANQIPGNITYSLANIANNEPMSIRFFSALFRTWNIGTQTIDVSNITLSGPTINNYFLLPQNPINALITTQNLLFSFTGVNKIYDNTINAFVTNPIITGIIMSDLPYVTISSYYSYYSDKFVANNKTIFVTNILLKGFNSTNYSINPTTTTTFSNIIPRQIYLISNVNTKIYDQNTIGTLSNVYLSGYFITDISFLSISSFVTNFININAGFRKIVNITNIILTGSYAFNYTISSTINTGTILQKPIPVFFTGVSKNFNSITLAEVTNISISNIINLDVVTISSYVSNFSDANVGVNKLISITNIVLGGTSGANYTVDPRYIPAYTNANITYPMQITLSQTSNTIVYKDISNYLTVTINPGWEIIPLSVTDNLLGIYQTFIISNINIYNNLVRVYTSSYILTNISMNDQNSGYVTCLSGYLISTTNAFTSVNINYIGNFNINAVSANINGVIFVVGSGGTIYKSNNNGLTWVLLNANTIINLTSVVNIDSINIFIIGNNGLLLVTTNGGSTWTSKTLTSNNLTSIDMINQYTGYIVGTNGLMLRTIDGINWTQILIGYTTNTMNKVFILSLNNVIIIGNGGIILQSINRGTTWSTIISGTLVNLNSIYMYSASNIQIVGFNGLILNYILNPDGVININMFNYNISKNNPIFITYLTSYLVNTYILNAIFTPTLSNNFGIAYSNVLSLTVKPIINFSTSITDTNYARSTIIYSVFPYVDQSGGIFSITDLFGTAVQQSKVIINILTGQIQFLLQINVNNYIFQINYNVNNISNQTTYNLIVRPELYYTINSSILVYNVGGSSIRPYVDQSGGTFTIIDLSGNLISSLNGTISLTTGIINFLRSSNINNYILSIIYTLNNVNKTTLYYLTVIPFINYAVNIANLEYQTTNSSIQPIVNNTGGIFTIFDISGTIVSNNQATINNNGIISFTNNIDVGFYYLNVVYTFNNIPNNFVYYLNASPYVLYPETYRVIQYEHTIYDGSSIPIYYPINGIFNIKDTSGTLINQNLVTINQNNGQLIFNIIGINSYMFLITYLLNNAYKTIYYTLQVKPIVRYNINQTIIIFGTISSSIRPYVNPINGFFSIIELGNVLVQLNQVNININTGIINFLIGIYTGNYNFTVNYTINNIYNSTNYNLQVLPSLIYNPNLIILLYGNAATSVLPIYSPPNGIFSLSGLINTNLITVNSATGLISFSNQINVGNYSFNVFYLINNVTSFYNYRLIVQPIIIYTIPSITLLYDRIQSNYSVKPFVNQQNGTFVIIDSSLNYLNLVSAYVNLDLSGIIQFTSIINVGIYNFTIYYTLNNVTNYAFYNLIIKPNLSYSVGNVTLLYDRVVNFYTEQPYFNQPSGVFSIVDSVGGLVNGGFAIINNITGIILLNQRINVGTYQLTITYTLRSSFNTATYNVIIQPNIYYIINSIITNYSTAIRSSSPYYIQLGGNFIIYDLSNSTIVQNNYAQINQVGIISFNNLINVGIYNLLIIYTLNNISNQTTFKITVNPNLTYSINFTQLSYKQTGNSVFPIYSQLNGTFSIFDILGNLVFNNLVYIDKIVGVIYFTAPISVGTYNFNIIYSLNYTSTNANYTLIVNPILDYTDKNKTILYERTTLSSTIPNYEEPNGKFSIIDNLGFLITNNQVTININTGIITFNTLINVGLYSFIVNYTLNGISVAQLYNLNVIPNLVYNSTTITVLYNSSTSSGIPYVNQINGIFSIIDVIGDLVNSNIIYINTNNGLFSIPRSINVGYYQFLITYSLNGTFNSTFFNLYVIPTIRYSNFIKILNYGIVSQSVAPVVNQTKGLFYIYDLSSNAVAQGGVSININSGIVTFQNFINVGIYVLNIQYQLNGVSNYFSYYLNVYPTILYTPSVQTILFNRPGLSYSNQPFVQQIGGNFTLNDLSGSELVQTNMIFSDLSGIIYFNQFIFVGNYSFNVKYTLNNLSVITKYFLTVIPNLVYSQTLVIIQYTEPYVALPPYYDQSGGIFSFTDTSGTLLSSRIINYDISGGLFNFIKNPDVGLYNLEIKYSLNQTSNSTNIVFYILPIINYNINTLTLIYSSNNYSIAPFVNQAKGYFTLTSNVGSDGIYIDTSNGIINFSFSAQVNNYILTIIYTLNSVFNTTNYYLTIIPVCDYNFPYLNAQYNVASNSEIAIYDPQGGIFTVNPFTTDISSYNTILNTISGGLIYISPNNGIIYFDQTLDVAIYPLIVIYTYNYIQNSVLFKFTMQPFVLYNPSNIAILYRDISFSVIPSRAPVNGIFSATVPLINLIYTGISINPFTGVIRFGAVNAGFWIITVKYTVNGVNKTILYNTQIIANVFYTPPYSVIPFNSSGSTDPPYSQVPGGQYSSTSTVDGFSINSTTGTLKFTNILTGVYFIPISYTIFGSAININYTLLVKPTIQYSPSNMSTYYTVPVNSVFPLVSPFGGVYGGTFADDNLTPLISTILIDSLSGLITTTSQLRVGKYVIAPSYTINSAPEVTTFTIFVYPNFNYSRGSAIVNYTSVNYSESPFTNPNLGVFTSSDINFYVDSSSGIIEFSNTISVGVYSIPIVYTYNLLTVTQNYNLTVNPIYYYNNNIIDVIIKSGGQSSIPVALQSAGVFSFITVSGTIGIPYGMSFLSSNDEYINNGIILNGYSGILNFGKNILVGQYDLTLGYTLYNLTANTVFTLIVRPYINYALSSLMLNYNTPAISSIPIVDQSGGFFYFSNSQDLQNQFNKIIINNNTGVINFYKGIAVGNYNLTITYIVNQISNFVVYNLNIRPNYYYAIASLKIISGDIVSSDLPIITVPGGFFSFIDSNGLDDLEITIDSGTGIINFLNIPAGTYNFTLNYLINGAASITSYTLIVKPAITYDSDTTYINYSFTGKSSVAIVERVGGRFGLENITSLGFQTAKVQIDISSGQISFLSYINSGNYDIVINYIFNRIKNLFVYHLIITPIYQYTPSQVSLSYIHLAFNSVKPVVNPSNGRFFFFDSSNNYPLQQITINNTTGIITVNKLPVGSYIINFRYYISNVAVATRYTITILSTFYYQNNSLSFNYVSNIYGDTYSFSQQPYADPSGGIFNFVSNVDQNFIINQRTGIIQFSNAIPINTYLLNIGYTYNNSITTTNYNLTVNPLFNYNENIKQIYYGNNGSSSIPNIYPPDGQFSISGIIGFSIDSTTGIITINNTLLVGEYYLPVQYNYNNFVSTVNYYVQILSNVYYDISSQIIIYGSPTITSSKVTSDSKYGLFYLNPAYNLIGIFVDSSSGILTFNKNININSYLISVDYFIYNIYVQIKYNLLVKPFIAYDISSVIINYEDIFISNLPKINPKYGLFDINYATIDSSGIIVANNLDVGIYNLNILYSINRITSNYNIKLTILPIIYYYTQPTILTYKYFSIPIIEYKQITYTIQSYSDSPIFNPTNGLFTLDISNMSIDNNGIITFDPSQTIGKYNIKVNYIINNVSQSANYYYKIVPYIDYTINSTTMFGKESVNSIIPDVRPTKGKFRSNLPNGITIDTSGVLLFSSTASVGTYSLIINYGFNDLSNNTVYNLIVNPYIYYVDGIFKYGIISKSELPVNNSYGGIFKLSFDPQSTIQINSLKIDISSGLITFDNLLSVGTFIFFVNYSKNNLIYTHTYNLTIQPVITYSNININHHDSYSANPLFVNPIGGIFTTINLPNFVTVNSNTGKIDIINVTNVGSFRFTIVYTVNNVQITSNIILNINPIIKYNNYNITYSEIGFTSSPYISISGGIFISNTLPSGLLLNQYSGIFNYYDIINVDSYPIYVTYIINDVSGSNSFNFTVKPYLNYTIDTTLQYGSVGTSIMPTTNPYGGLFTISGYHNITIDQNYGIINFPSNIPVNNYYLLVTYNYNNIIVTYNFSLTITSKLITVKFIAYDKTYDGQNTVIMKYNTLSGVINNDRVFINTYTASFSNSNKNKNIPILISNLTLGGTNLSNYTLLYNDNPVGNIYLAIYEPNYIKVNIRNIGNSVVPIISSYLTNALFLILNPTNGITIDPFGIIYWDNTLQIGIYKLNIQVFNGTLTDIITFTIEVTTNLYEQTQLIIPSIIPSVTFKKLFYQLQYSSNTGLPYVLDNTINGLIGKFNITAYNNDNIIHDLNNYYDFNFILQNADPSGNLVAYEYNDDGTVNYTTPYKLSYIDNKQWTTKLRFLSDFNIQDLAAVYNTPPSFNPRPGTYYHPFDITIEALPNSIIYYTMDGTEPTLNSQIYSTPLHLTDNITIKAFAITPGHANSSVVTAVYIVYNLPCLLSKTLIRTPYGNELIDNLKEGDLVVTGDNRTVPIMKILKCKINDPKDSVLPVIVPKDFFGPNVPDRNTYISHNHAIKAASDFWVYGEQNNFPKHNVEPLYYHIKLPKYFTDDLIANNMVVESWTGLDPKNGTVKYTDKQTRLVNNRKLFGFKRINKIN